MLQSYLFIAFCVILIICVVIAKLKNSIDNFLFYSSLVLISLSLGFYLVIKYTNYFYSNELDLKNTYPKKLNVKNEDVKYFENYSGYYAHPDREGTYPGIIMIHEWWGLNEHIKEKANELAVEGYNVLAVDLFGTVANNPDDARKQSSSLDQEKAIENLKAAKQFLIDKNSSKIGSLGWCFGGAQSLQISTNEKVDATVIYYGNVSLPKEKLKNISSPVLGIFGDKDVQIPVPQVNQFEKNLKDLSITNNIYIYQGVGHAFANPSNPNYAVNETEDAWEKTLQFLNDNLK
jgi:carboxymethylenebutenolidase